MTEGRWVCVSRRSAAPPERVWQVLADPYSYDRWVLGTATIRDTDDSWPQPGARLYHSFGPWLLRLPDHTEVLAAEPPHRLALEARARPWARVRAELLLAAEGTGTRIDFRERAVGGWAAHLDALSARLQRWRMARSLVRLADLAER